MIARRLPKRSKQRIPLQGAFVRAHSHSDQDLSGRKPMDLWGNEQKRFELVTSTVLPTITLISPAGLLDASEANVSHKAQKRTPIIAVASKEQVFLESKMAEISENLCRKARRGRKSNGPKAQPPTRKAGFTPRTDGDSLRGLFPEFRFKQPNLWWLRRDQSKAACEKTCEGGFEIDEADGWEAQLSRSQGSVGKRPALTIG